MIDFLGEYEATLDTKGRFLLPGALKKQLPEGENRFVISRGFEKCLNLYPMKTWEKIMERIGKLNDFDPKVRQFKLLFLAGASADTLPVLHRWAECIQQSQALGSPFVFDFSLAPRTMAR